MWCPSRRLTLCHLPGAAPAGVPLRAALRYSARAVAVVMVAVTSPCGTPAAPRQRGALQTPTGAALVAARCADAADRRRGRSGDELPSRRTQRASEHRTLWRRIVGSPPLRLAASGRHGGGGGMCCTSARDDGRWRSRHGGQGFCVVGSTTVAPLATAPSGGGAATGPSSVGGARAGRQHSLAGPAATPSRSGGPLLPHARGVNDKGAATGCRRVVAAAVVGSVSEAVDGAFVAMLGHAPLSSGGIGGKVGRGHRNRCVSPRTFFFFLLMSHQHECSHLHFSVCSSLRCLLIGMVHKKETIGWRIT